MKLKIFTLRLNPATGLFDEGELVSFQLGKDVIEISEHFLVHEKTPTLLLVLRYRDIPDNGGGAHQSQEAVPDPGCGPKQQDKATVGRLMPGKGTVKFRGPCCWTV
ncbi:MAG: hypothetical protein PHV33_05385 [Elusimicrobiales bacterium]|nr:hypothetical protein [Elusimicrobiales bacterium]